MPNYRYVRRPKGRYPSPHQREWLPIVMGLLFGGYVLTQLGPGASGGGVFNQSQTLLDQWLGNYPLPELRALALVYANRDRQAHGLPPLVEDPRLTEAAQRHAEDMLARQFYGHINPDGQDPSDRFRMAGGQQGAGENLVQQKRGIPTALSPGLIADYQQGWMNSPGHRENLLTPDYQTFGYGIVANSTGTEIYAVQMFSFLD